jgi:hypothetical protein
MEIKSFSRSGDKDPQGYIICKSNPRLSQRRLVKKLLKNKTANILGRFLPQVLYRAGTT